MNSLAFSLEEIFKGIGSFLKDRYPALFDTYRPNLEVIEPLVEPEHSSLARFSFEHKGRHGICFKCLEPDSGGIYYMNGNKYSSPLVLVRKSGIEKMKELDLEKHFAIPGYFLSLALKMAGVLRYLSRNGESVDIEKVKDAAECRFNRQKTGVEYHRLEPAGGSDENEISDRKGEDSNGKFIWIKVPVLFELQDSNDLLKISDLRKVVVPGDRVPESMRLPHSSHIGRLDLLETPESEQIGMTLFMASGASYDAEKLEIIKSEDGVEGNFSPSTRMVPFIMYSDGARVTMGGKNLKQAVRVVGSEKPLITTPIYDEIDMNVGVNALVGYALYRGLNFEDGIVCSESFAEKMAIDEVKSMTFEDFVPLTPDSEIRTAGKSKVIIESKKAGIKVEYTFRSGGSEVRKTDWLFKREVFRKREGGWSKIKDSYSAELYGSLYPGVIQSNASIDQIRPVRLHKLTKGGGKEKNLSDTGMVEVTVKVRINKPLEVGDKITGRHGNKGTISKILPDSEMPFVELNGRRRPLDLILSPFGVITRMNLGQLLETQKSLEGAYVDEPFKPLDIAERLKENQLSSKPRSFLNFPDGKSFEATVGYQYFVRLDHCVRDKLHVVRQAEVSPITGQPVKGKRRDGGQRIGEMEFWTLFDHNAINTINAFSVTNTEDPSRFKEDYFWAFRTLVNTYRGVDPRTIAEPCSISFQKAGEIDVEENCPGDKKKVDAREKFLHEIRPKNKKIPGSDKDKHEKSKKLEKLEKKYLLTKNGYLRRYMLGRRIHYSARATITPVTDIDIDHVYLPLEMALEWLEELKEMKIDSPEERVAAAARATGLAREKGLMVLLNRQPSLHKHSITAAKPLFWEHRTIGLPIMLCEGFGADFDGDTMAVYFPVQGEPGEELERMLPSFSPYRVGNGELIYSIDQDLVYGEYVRSGRKKPEVKNNVLEIVQSSKNLPAELLEWQKKTLDASMNSTLSISFAELATLSGNALEIKESGSRGKEENFKLMPAFSKGMSLEEYTGRPEAFDPMLTIAGRSRAGLMDKKLHVAQAGYFTRKMVEFLYPLRISEIDCETEEGIRIDRADFEMFARCGVDFSRFLLGRYVKRPEDEGWRLVTRDDVKEYGDSDLIVRSPVTCRAVDGLCSKCCGLELSTMREHEIGDYIGVLAGHTIGERGTQLSMKNFQTGSSGFNMQRVSSEFFKRIRPTSDLRKSKRKEENEIEDDYVEYIKRLAERSVEDIMGVKPKEGQKGTPLLKSIDVSSIYFEILFRRMKDLSLRDESGVKEYLSSLERGFFSALSFERGRGGIEPLEGRVIAESSPKAIYALLPGEVKK